GPGALEERSLPDREVGPDGLEQPRQAQARAARRAAERGRDRGCQGPALAPAVAPRPERGVETSGTQRALEARRGPPLLDSGIEHAREVGHARHRRLPPLEAQRDLAGAEALPGLGRGAILLR